jgi:hypothetical protein
MEKTTLKNAALSYWEKGYNVFPVGIDKTPKVQWGQYRTIRVTREQIEDWWTRWPDANIGLPTGSPSGVMVVDFDKKSGGLETLKSLRLPPTLVIRTGGGGFHYYFKYTSDYHSCAGILPGVDIRNDNGYVLLPPSVHKSGNCYEVVADDFGESKEELYENLPEFPTDQIKPNGGAKKTSDWRKYANGCTEGKRNEVATKMCGVFMNAFHPNDWGIAWELLKGWNTLNKPPIGIDELKLVFNSIAKKSLPFWEEKIKLFNENKYEQQNDQEKTKPTLD